MAVHASQTEQKTAQHGLTLDYTFAARQELESQEIRKRTVRNAKDRSVEM